MNLIIVALVVLLFFIGVYSTNETFADELSLFRSSKPSSLPTSLNYSSVYLTNPDPDFIFNGSVTILSHGKHNRYVYDFNLPNIEGGDYNSNNNTYIAMIGKGNKLSVFAYLSRDGTGQYRAETMGHGYDSFAIGLKKTGQIILSGSL